MIRNRIEHLRERARGIGGSEPPFHLAREEDIYYCYRLLLQREPDPVGYDSWKLLVRSSPLPLEALVNGFTQSLEYRTLEAQRQAPTLVELADFKIYVRLSDPFVGAVLHREKVYEPYVVSELRPLLKRGDVFMDLGANIGYFTLMAAKLVGPDGRVLAFEPNPANCELLEASIRANGFQNVRLYPYAVDEREGTLYLTVAGSDGHLVDELPADLPSSLFPQATTVVLDEVLADLERLDIIKMDIDGAEARAWRGMQRLIRQFQPVILLEFCPELLESVSGESPPSFLESVQAHDYDFFILERSEQKSQQPQSVAAILDRLRETGLDHLDLLAVPRNGDASY